MLLLSISFVLIFTSLIVAQNDGIFYNPPEGGPIGNFSRNPIYVIGETVQIRWTVSWANISLVLWQNDNNNFEYLLPAVSNPNNYNWIVRTNKDISLQNVFFLQVFNAGTNNKFGSHYFNLTESSVTTSTISTSTSSAPSTSEASQTTTSSAPSTSETSQTTTTSASALITPPASQVSQSTTPSASSGLDASSKVGLGVGLGLGIPLLIATVAAVWLFYRRHRRRDGNTYPNLTEEPPWQDFKQSVPLSRPVHELPERSRGIEMEGTIRNHELPGA